MMPSEYALLTAERHVREAESHVRRQKEIIEKLRLEGHPTLDAESLLLEFEATLKDHRDALEALKTSQAQFTRERA